jgi:hypothetical protein
LLGTYCLEVKYYSNAAPLAAYRGCDGMPPRAK